MINKDNVTTCGNCIHLDYKNGVCLKYRCPLPLNINLQFLKCSDCFKKED